MLPQFSLLRKFKIVGHSMEPNLLSGMQVLVSSLPFWIRSPRIGDIVAVKHPHQSIILIKRISKKNTNGYFVVGDNSHDSLDSRTFGYITRKELIGKVVAKL